MDHQQIMREIDAQVQKLHSWRNTYTVLPHELLLDIFLRVRDNCMSVKEWHSITHVCQIWRNIAINAPILWTQPPTEPGHGDYTNLMLERSKTANLRISLQLDDVSEDAVTALSNHVERIQYLQLLSKSPSIPLSSACGSWLSLGQRFTRLESLIVKNVREKTVGLDVFFSQVPSLRRLSMKDVSIGRHQLPIGLTILELSFEFHHEPESFVPNLLQSLAHMVHLQTLFLNFLSPNPPKPPPNSQTINVRLPLLQKLRVRCDDTGVGSFLVELLSKLELPNLGYLDIVAHMRNMRDANLAYTALDIITTMITKGRFQTEATGTLQIYTPGMAVVQDRSKVVQLKLTNSSPSIWCDYTLLNRQCAQLVAIFPRLVTVDIFDGFLQVDDFIKAVGTLPELKTIVIRFYVILVSWLIKALQRVNCSCHASPCVAHTRFPALDTIFVDSVRWTSETEVKEFCNVLLRRSQFATAVKRLYWWQQDKNQPAQRPPEWMIELLRGGGIRVEECNLVPWRQGL